MTSSILKAYSGVFVGKGEQLELGDRIILPPSVLSSIMGNGSASLSGPMIFKLTNPNNDLFIHCGVLEFGGQYGKCYLPFWMMQYLQLSEGEDISVVSASPPDGTFVRLQPLDRAFQKIDRPKEVYFLLFSY